jgi:hypothetical protein
MQYTDTKYTIHPIGDWYSTQHTLCTMQYTHTPYTIHPIGDRLRELGAVSLDGAEWFEKAGLGVLTAQAVASSQ